MNYISRPGMKIDIVVRDEEIIRVVCKHFNVTIAQLKQKNRKHGVVFARQVAYYLLSTVGKSTCTKIGEYFNRDHTTVLYGTQAVRNYIDTDPARKKEIDLLRTKIAG